MIIKKASIECFGNIKRSTIRFNDKISIIKRDNADDYMLAMAGWLSYPVSRPAFNKKRGEKGLAAFYVDRIDEIERLNADNILGASKEYMSCSIFYNADDERFDERLHRYLKVSDYYEEGEFDRLTNYFGSTKTFRAYLHKFIAEFPPQLLCSGKCIEIYIDKNGYFKCRNSESKEDICLDCEEKILFRLFCFKTLHSFWEGAAELRSLETPHMPLLIGNVFEHLHNKEYENQIKRMLEGNAQVVIFAAHGIDNAPFLVHNIEN